MDTNYAPLLRTLTDMGLSDEKKMVEDLIACCEDQYAALYRIALAIGAERWSFIRGAAEELGDSETLPQVIARLTEQCVEQHKPKPVTKSAGSPVASIRAAGILLTDVGMRGLWLSIRGPGKDYAGCLQNPGGKCGPDEFPKVAACRETAEETGIYIPAERLMPLCHATHVSPSGVPYEATQFLAITQFVPQNMEPTKAQPWKFYTWDELVDLQEQCIPTLLQALKNVPQFRRAVEVLGRDVKTKPAKP